MFTDEEVPELSDKLENYYWHNILDILLEDKEIELQGKIPKTLNRTMRHLAFLKIYFESMQLMQDDIQRGIFIKAICEYMFEGKERKLKPLVISSTRHGAICILIVKNIGYLIFYCGIVKKVL